MKLQVNIAGAWRNVCEFPTRRYGEVKGAVQNLAPLVDADWCIVRDDGRRDWINGGRRRSHAAPETRQVAP